MMFTVCIVRSSSGCFYGTAFCFSMLWHSFAEFAFLRLGFHAVIIPSGGESKTQQFFPLDHMLPDSVSVCPLLCFSHYVRQNQHRPFTALRYVSFCAFRFTSTSVVSPGNKVLLTYGEKSCGIGRCNLCSLESTRGA